MATNYEIKKLLKTKNQCGLKNINIISKNQQTKMVARDMCAVKKAQHL